MAFAHPFDFQRPPSQLSIVDRKPGAFANIDEDLEDSLFETNSIMSPFSSHRKESFAGDSVFSPQSSSFDDPSASWGRDPSISNNPFYEQHQQNNNPFTRLPTSQAASYGQQPAAWPPVFDNTSGSCTPTTAKTFDSSGHDFDPGPPGAFGHAVNAGPSPFSGVPVQNNVRPSSVFQPVKQPMPSSPHTHKEWMALAQQEAENSSRQFPKRMRQSSPPRTYSSLPRGDGIRKKNARFEIPAERSLANIDDLIRQSTNEEEIKELKQQKRLLRNRQAALDSRQRKKRHTEELEDEKKAWVESQQMLESSIIDHQAREQQYLSEKDYLLRRTAELEQMVEQLRLDKEDMVVQHTRETGELRKKVSVLSEELKTNGGVPMSVAPSSQSYTEFTSGMDNLNMGGDNDWQDFFTADFMDQEVEHPNFQQPSTSMIVAHRKKDSPLSITEQDKPVASGLLLMLLLCGAFVASKSSGSTAPAIRVPEDVRAASAVVLESVYKDAGVAPDQTTRLTANHLQAFEPGPSGVAWPAKSTLTGAEFASLSNPPSALDTLSGQLTAPTKEQEAEQAFSITPAQYNSFTSADFHRRVYSIPSSENDDPLSPLSASASGRRNLADTLASLREQSKGESAADVYTRSLLWDKIPAEVVRDFKRMVEESQELDARHNGGGGQVKCEAGAT